ncbi:MAG: hypothetical protein GX219_03600 [Tissierellia bacterium]|nr:hypothetical protein [Tissierellia bacterium]
MVEIWTEGDTLLIKGRTILGKIWLSGKYSIYLDMNKLAGANGQKLSKPVICFFEIQ